MRALLVVIALSFSMAIMLSIPVGVIANQKATEDLTNDLTATITKTEASINQTLKQVDCRLDPCLAGYGFEGYEYTWVPQNMIVENITINGVTMEVVRTEARFAEKADLEALLLGSTGTVPMNQSLYSDIASIEGVAAVAPILHTTEGHTETQHIFNRYFTIFVEDYEIVGIPLISDLVDNYPILPTNITAGRNLQAGDSGVVLLSEDNAAFFGAGVGDKIDILEQPFEVVGIHRLSAVEDATTLYMNLSDLQSLKECAGVITRLLIFTESGDLTTEVSNAIGSLHTELIVVTFQQRLEQLQADKASYTAALQSAQADLIQTQTTAMQEIIVAVAATSLIILFMMLYTVRERTKEIGTLKAMGFTSGTVMSQFVIEGTLVSIIAGLVGIAIGIFAAPTLSSFLLPTFGSEVTSAGTFAIAPQFMLLGFGAAVLLGALGSLYPAWRASRTNPAEAMRYE
jgi:putative ABC transport system permease protein